MKIKLSRCYMFDPKEETLISYIVGVIAIFFILLAYNYSWIWYPIAIGAQTLILLWFETTYYPYGIKEGD